MLPEYDEPVMFRLSTAQGAADRVPDATMLCPLHRAVSTPDAAAARNRPSMLPIPRPLHRLALRIAQPLRLRWWKLARIRTNGCRVVAQNARGDVLMIRHTYHCPDEWMLPGGGVDRGEDPCETATREVREETGCRMTGVVRFGEVVERHGGWTNVVHLVAGRTDDAPVADGREIAEARFIPVEDLPGTVAAKWRERIGLWLERDANSDRPPRCD